MDFKIETVTRVTGVTVTLTVHEVNLIHGALEALSAFDKTSLVDKWDDIVEAVGGAIERVREGE